MLRFTAVQSVNIVRTNTRPSARRKYNPEIYACGRRAVIIFDSTYINPFGEQYTVNKFRYYISNIIFVGNAADTKTIRFDTTILVDETKPASKEITLPVPEGSYNAITFLLGVDSIKNVSGAQSGALDPLQDMFWTWSTGYVMAKLEGNSPASKLPRRMFEYHIGGFAGRNNALKNIQLNSPDKRSIPISKTSGQQIQQIVISADINAWFNSVHELKIAANPACTFIGELAKKYADNYSNMFAIRSIGSQ